MDYLLAKELVPGRMRAYIRRRLKSNKPIKIGVVNALSGSIPVFLKELFPQAEIVCLEYFPYYHNWLRHLGFKVVDWNKIKNMKFDVIIGNPPYQHPSKSGGNKLWYRFIKDSLDLIKDGGYLCMVTPNQWVCGGNQIGKWGVLKNAFAENYLVYADVRDLSPRYFKGIGIKIGYWLLQKTPSNGRESTFQLDDGTKKIVLKGEKIFSSLPKEVSYSIVEKVLGNNLPKVEITQTPNNKSKDWKEEPKGRYKFPHYKQGSDTSNNLKIVYLKEIYRADLSYRKVVTPATYWQPHFDNEGIPISSSSVGYAIKTKPEDTKEGFESVYYSHLFSYLGYLQQGLNGYLLYSYMRKFPEMDMSRVWTNQEIYKHFKLTKKEIKEIEECVVKKGKKK